MESMVSRSIRINISMSNNEGQRKNYNYKFYYSYRHHYKYERRLVFHSFTTRRDASAGHWQPVQIYEYRMNDYAKIKTKFLSRYYRASDNNELNSMKRRLVRQIKSVMDGNKTDQNDEWNVVVSNDVSLMAYSKYNKRMFVTTGLLDIVNDDLLAAVIALKITRLMDNHRRKRYFLKIIRYLTIFASVLLTSSLVDVVIFGFVCLIRKFKLILFDRKLEEDMFNKAYEMTKKFGLDKNEFRELLEMQK